MHPSLNRRLPLTQFHWRFFLPKPSRAIQIQRQVFLLQYAHYSWFSRVGLWCWAQLRWCLYFAPLGIAKCYRYYADRHFEQHRQAKYLQLLQLIRLAYAYSIPPRYYYALSLHRYAAADWPNFVFDYQAGAWHSACHRNARANEMMTLEDKALFSEFMQSNGIASVPTLLKIDDQQTIANLTDLPTQFFCKPVTGKHSRGCLSVTQAGDSGLDIRSISTGRILENQTLEQLNQIVSERPYILQETLDNEPALAKIFTSELSVMRAVTIFCEGEARLIQAHWLSSLSEGEAKAALVVEPETGECRLPSIELDSALEVKLQEILPSLNSWMREHWQEMCSLCINAQTLLPSVSSIGWDVAFSSTGAVLLEGNIRWALEFQQYLENTPMLASDRAASFAQLLGLD